MKPSSMKPIYRLAIALSLSVWVASCSHSPTADRVSTEATSAAPETSLTQQPISQSILIDGSSTVYPLTDEAVKEYQFEQENEPQFAVAFSGTTSGFRKFCAGETDISVC